MKFYVRDTNSIRSGTLEDRNIFRKDGIMFPLIAIDAFRRSGKKSLLGKCASMHFKIKVL